MTIDYGAFPPPPSKTALRVRFAPEGIRVHKGGWKFGGWLTVVLVIGGWLIVRNLFGIFQAAQQIWAKQGVNAANLGAIGRAVVIQVGVPLVVVILVLLIVALRSALRLGDYWHLLLGSDQWQLRGLFGVRVFARVAPSDISGIVVAQQGQVMAECEGGWQPLSGLLTPADASWLREALLGFLKKPADEVNDRLGHEELGVESSTSGPAVPDWPQGSPSLAGDIFPPSHVVGRPGKTLRFELLPFRKARTGCVTCLLVLLGFMLISGMIGVIVALALPAARARPFAWVGSAVQVALALGVLGYFFRRRRVQALAPRLEISNHPLNSGSTYEACVCQPGPRLVESICVRLVCEETAKYTDGTITRTASEQVYQREIWRNDDVQVTEDAPLAERFSVGVPARAMHSFQSSNNSITWKLVVEEQAAGQWSAWRCDYPVVVLPAESTP